MKLVIDSLNKKLYLFGALEVEKSSATAKRETPHPAAVSKSKSDPTTSHSRQEPTTSSPSPIYQSNFLPIPPPTPSLCYTPRQNTLWIPYWTTLDDHHPLDDRFGVYESHPTAPAHVSTVLLLQKSDKMLPILIHTT